MVKISPWKVPLRLGGPDSINYKTVRTTQISLTALQNQSHQAKHHRPFIADSDPPSFFLADFFVDFWGPKSTWNLWSQNSFLQNQSPNATHRQLPPCLALPEQRCRMDARFYNDFYFHLSCSALDSTKEHFRLVFLLVVPVLG